MSDVYEFRPRRNEASSFWNIIGGGAHDDMTVGGLHTTI